MRYSQKDEEDWIVRFAGPPGRFWDIGAFDGERFSNTRALLDSGWEGILVEPGLEAFGALHANLGNHPRASLVHAAVVPSQPTGSYARLAKFWPNPATFSTTTQDNVDKFIHEGFGSPYWTAAITIADLAFHFPGSVEVLSIDTEGTSVDLLLDLPPTLRPRVIAVEHDGRQATVDTWAKLRGYRSVMRNEENIILVGGSE